ncbi:MAG: segregation/condensation protein A [Patescibacteria group bacterium]
MSYEIKLAQYQGPLDVLLQFIEQEQLSITDIALAQITDSFIVYLDTVEELFPEELADFLVIATRLLYLKSRELLPYLITEDDEPATNLAEHLKMYKEFRDASSVLEDRLAHGQYACVRPVSLARLDTVEFNPPAGIATHHLYELYEGVLARLDTVIKIPQAAIRKAITLKEKIATLYSVLQQHKQLQFSDLIQDNKDRMNVVITFLAILELMKQNNVTVQQPKQYSDILIVCN